MMKSFAAAITLGAASASNSMNLKFVSHMVDYGLAINSMGEFKTRFDYFRTLDKLIEEHNANIHIFKLGHN